MTIREQILAVVDEYQKTNSITSTAREIGLSTATVRKMLLTAGIWSNKASNDISIIRREHPAWDNKKIAETLRISIKAVQMYSPYEGLSSSVWPENNPCLSENGIIDSGSCGDDVTWQLERNGTLTLSGFGPMWNYGGSCNGIWGNPRPKWWARRDGIKVKKVVVEEGITSVGEYAFCQMIDLESVQLPSTITEIRGGAFCGENHVRRFVIPEKVTFIAWDTFYSNVLLEEIRIPAGVFKIQTYAFHACMSLRRMYFYGDAPRYAKSAFDMCPEGMVTVYRKKDAKGFGETWAGYKTAEF